MGCGSTAQVDKGGHPSLSVWRLRLSLCFTSTQLSPFLYVLSLLAFRIVTRPEQLPHGLGHSGGRPSRAGTNTPEASVSWNIQFPISTIYLSGNRQLLVAVPTIKYPLSSFIMSNGCCYFYKSFAEEKRLTCPDSSLLLLTVPVSFPGNFSP